MRKFFLTVSDLFSLHKGGNNWLEKPILKCRDEVETFQRLREPIVSSRVKGKKFTNSKKKSEHSKKREKNEQITFLNFTGIFVYRSYTPKMNDAKLYFWFLLG